jgi:hypothetical protein
MGKRVIGGNDEWNRIYNLAAPAVRELILAGEIVVPGGVTEEEHNGAPPDGPSPPDRAPEKPSAQNEEGGPKPGGRR